MNDVQFTLQREIERKRERDMVKNERVGEGKRETGRKWGIIKSRKRKKTELRGLFLLSPDIAFSPLFFLQIPEYYYTILHRRLFSPLHNIKVQGGVESSS